MLARTLRKCNTLCSITPEHSTRRSDGARNLFLPVLELHLLLDQAFIEEQRYDQRPLHAGNNHQHSGRTSRCKNTSTNEAAYQHRTEECQSSIPFGIVELEDLLVCAELYQGAGDHCRVELRHGHV